MSDFIFFFHVGEDSSFFLLSNIPVASIVVIFTVFFFSIKWITYLCDLPASIKGYCDFPFLEKVPVCV
ncbi:hypothetical protein AYI68_g5819 [Smittium mucronatum]|uniref:Uncharacterized protein n=1 Tax=Smittium mucronatum TaxID=133383 RepID=A0A1R0GT81_9FUNG|nr:hypothetical protein AYI68_g5819 [Smittium mucronatum]